MSEGRMSRRRFFAGGVVVAGAAVFGPDIVRDALREGAKGVIEGLNPFTKEESERVLGIFPQRLQRLDDVGLVRRPYLVRSKLREGWKYIPGWVAGEEVVLTTRWWADWKMTNFSTLTQRNVFIVPEKRLVVLALPRPKPVSIGIDITYNPKTKRRPGAINLGTLVEQDDFNEVNGKAIQLTADNDSEAAGFADDVGEFSFGSFCTALLQGAGCLNANFAVAYQGDPVIADLALRYGKEVEEVAPDGPPKPLQLYSAAEAEPTITPPPAPSVTIALPSSRYSP